MMNSDENEKTNSVERTETITLLVNLLNGPIKSDRAVNRITYMPNALLRTARQDHQKKIAAENKKETVVSETNCSNYGGLIASHRIEF